jgi:hypothetical protein
MVALACLVHCVVVDVEQGPGMGLLKRGVAVQPELDVKSFISTEAQRCSVLQAFLARENGEGVLTSDLVGGASTACEHKRQRLAKAAVPGGWGLAVSIVDEEEGGGGAGVTGGTQVVDVLEGESLADAGTSGSFTAYVAFRLT